MGMISGMLDPKIPKVPNPGLVLREPFLFSGTIQENFLYGKSEAGEEEMLKVNKTLRLHDIVQQFPEGYDTQVQERGSRLSPRTSGSWYPFAGAIITDPRILILDEATANIDTQTEKIIQEGAKGYAGGPDLLRHCPPAENHPAGRYDRRHR